MNAAIEAARAGQGFSPVRRTLVQAGFPPRLLPAEAPLLRTPLAYRLVHRPQTVVPRGEAMGK
ncbi:hypothetical protein D8B22_17540 [Verminephrobacter aporrectodeae subsp. tuberculatae]|nr:hypothetical protein [Verminephrobacter aporrectodeae subsp. tuberculatae]MCW8209468.1 hypothetical protein [Verminephrobacter aporrectodeae subsp. tuberculatae]